MDQYKHRLAEGHEPDALVQLQYVCQASKVHHEPRFKFTAELLPQDLV